MARAGADNDPVAFAIRHYGERVAVLTRAAVAAGGISSGNWGEVLATPEAAEFRGQVEQASIVGRLNGLRNVPMNVRMQLMTEGFTAYWVGGGKSKPLSKAAVEGDTLRPLKVAVVTALTREFLRHASPASEERFRTDMIRAIAEAIDAAFIDPANTGTTDVMPASVTNGVTPLASAGDPATDLAALVTAFTGDFSTASFVTDPTTAAQIALARDAAGGFLFPDCGPRGGSLLNIPLIVSRSSPRDSSGGLLALVDAAGIAYGSEGVRNLASDQATLEMTDDGTAGPVNQVSMWQTNSTAILSEASVNWKVARAGAVQYVSDATYPTVPA
jgi:HK97 family phage major capsid protein